jgi:phosphoglycolate phosphatase
MILSFDLDFTLINNTEGIVNSFNYALQKFSIKPLKRTEIIEMIGLPLHSMFERITNKDSKELSKAFREYYSSKGITEVKFIEGAKEKLIELYDQEYILGIITSKKQELAKKFVEIHKISFLFEFILGETNERKGKIHPSIKVFFELNYPNEDIIIIGDHVNDKQLAEYLNFPFIGVLTGNHNEEDLQNNIKVKYKIINNVTQINERLISYLTTQKEY